MNALKSLEALVVTLVIFSTVLFPAQAQSIALAGLHGAQPVLTILCKLGGEPLEPEPPAYFESLVLGSTLSLNEYWQEVSYGAISLAGSQVTPWVTLPHTADGYRKSDGKVDLMHLAKDCMATASVDVKRFAATNLIFNVDMDKQPWGGPACFDTNGVTECRPATWLWPRQLHNLAYWAHELGHAFGLQHPAGEAGRPYEDTWSAMSDTASCRCGKDHTAIPQHISAVEKDQLGWIATERKYTAAANSMTAVALSRLARPTAEGYLLAVVPWNDATGGYYAVEARQRNGYDQHLPGAAVVIHSVNPADRAYPVHLISHSADRQDGAAAAWEPGDSFRDEAHRVAVTVERETLNGFVVTISTGDAAGKAPLAGQPAQPAAAVRNIALESTGGTGLAMAEAEGTLYFAWAAPDGSGQNTALHVCRQAASGAPVVDTLNECWSNAPGDRPVLAGDPGGMYMAWAGWTKPFAYPAQRLSARPDIVVSRALVANWGEPVTVPGKTSARSQVSPALAMGPAGRLYMAWIGQKTLGGDVYFSSMGGSVERINDVGDDAWRAAPAIVADHAGEVTAAWVDTRSGRPQVYTATRSAGGRWSANKAVAPAREAQAAPALAIDRTGNVYATWINYTTCGRGNGALGTVMLAVKPAGRDWQAATVIAANVEGGRESQPVVAVNRAGQAIVAWQAYDDDGVAVYTAGMTGHGTAVRLLMGHTGLRTIERPALTADAKGVVRLAWLAGDKDANRIEVVEL